MRASKKGIVHLLPLILVSILLVGSAFYIYFNRNNLITQTDQNTNINEEDDSIDIVNDDVEEKNIYVDDFFSIELPPDWAANIEFGAVSVMNNNDAVTFSIHSIGFVSGENEFLENIGDIKAREYKSVDSEEIKLGEHTAVTFKYEDGKSERIYVLVDKLIVEVLVENRTTEYNNILATLSAINPDEDIFIDNEDFGYSIKLNRRDFKILEKDNSYDHASQFAYCPNQALSTLHCSNPFGHRYTIRVIENETDVNAYVSEKFSLDNPSCVIKNVTEVKDIKFKDKSAIKLTTENVYEEIKESCPNTIPYNDNSYLIFSHRGNMFELTGFNLTATNTNDAEKFIFDEFVEKISLY